MRKPGANRPAAETFEPNDAIAMRLNLLQMMKLVVGCALASAYVLPFVRLAEAGIATWSAMFVVGAIGSPLVFALATIFLARQGPLKSWLIRILALTSVGVALGVVTHANAGGAANWIQRGMPLDLHSLALLAVVCLPVVIFGFVFVRLLRGVVSARSAAFGGSRSCPRHPATRIWR